MALSARISKISLVECGGYLLNTLAQETGIPQYKLTILSVTEDASSPHYLVIYEVEKEVIDA